MKLIKIIPYIFILAACASKAEVTISDAWVRANAPGQKIGAAYMTLISPTKSKLVYVEAIDAADSVEIHSMSMNNGVMKMRMLEELTLEPNKPASLKPGSFHLMLFDLKQSLKEGAEIKFRFCFKDESGKITDQFITIPVKSQ
jgi:periplasmic copper chaperone A